MSLKTQKRIALLSALLGTFLGPRAVEVLQVLLAALMP